MKSLKIYYQFVVIVITTISFVSCSGDDYQDPQPVGIGFLHLKELKADLSFITKTGKEANTAKSVPVPSQEEIDTWQVQIFDNNGMEVDAYNDYSAVPDPLSLWAGNYTVYVNSEDNSVAFDNPFFEGTSNLFTITPGNSENISVTAKLANAQVTVVYDSGLSANFADYNTEVSSAAGNLTFGINETRSGFFPVDEDLETYVTLEDTFGNQYQLGPLQIPGKTLQAGELAPQYIINVDFELGAASIAINADGTTEDISYFLTNAPDTFEWNGGALDEFFTESHWLDITGTIVIPSINPSEAVGYHLIVDAPISASLNDLILADGVSLTVKGGSVYTSFGIPISSPAGSTGNLVLEGGRVDTDFLENLSVSMDGGSILALYENITPSIVNTTVNMVSGSNTSIRFVNQTVASISSELNFITVDGTPAADGVNVTIGTDGADAVVTVN